MTQPLYNLATKFIEEKLSTETYSELKMEREVIESDKAPFPLMPYLDRPDPALLLLLEDL